MGQEFVVTALYTLAEFIFMAAFLDASFHFSCFTAKEVDANM